MAARRIDHDGVFAEQARCVLFAHTAMFPRMIKVGCSRVDTRERAGMIFAGCPEVIRAERIAVHKAATDTDVVFSKTTWMKRLRHCPCDL